MTMSENLKDKVLNHRKEMSDERHSKNPRATPPEKFDQTNEADFRAYMHVIPNRPMGGGWFSKERFGSVYVDGSEYPYEIATGRIVKNPAREPETSADPTDWGELMPQYLYWRERYRKSGFNVTRGVIETVRDALAGIGGRAAG